MFRVPRKIQNKETNKLIRFRLFQVGYHNVLPCSRGFALMLQYLFL